MTFLTYQLTPLELLDRVDHSIANYTALVYNSKKYGDPCPDGYEAAISHLLGVRDALKREVGRRDECSIVEEERYIPYLVGDYTDPTTVDDSGEDSWILRNPKCTCINKEQWEQCSFNFCKSIGITFTRKDEEVCKLAFEITQETIDPCVGIALAITTKAKDLGYHNSRNHEDCKLDYKIAVEKGCDIEFSVYKKAYQSGLTYDLIKLIYDNNLEVARS